MSATHLPKKAFRELEVDRIVITDMDLRDEKYLDQDKIDGLSQTIDEVDILQPILVSLDSARNEYRLILGGRRLRAAIKSHREKIPAFIVDDLKDNDALIMMLIENMQRDDLHPLEEARGMAELRDRFGDSESDIARTIGRNETFVRDRLALLRLPKEVLERVQDGSLGVSQATSITRIEGRPAAQKKIMQNTIDRDLSVEIVDRMVDQVAFPKAKRRKSSRKHHLKRTGDQLSDLHMTKKVQQTVIRGERLINFVDGLPMQRWTPDKASELGEVIGAIQEDMKRLKARVLRRSKQDE